MSTLDPFEGVPKPLRIALHDRGFTSLTAVQQAVLAADSEGHDLRISSQTGSGKTVALGFALARHLLAPESEARPAVPDADADSDEPPAPPSKGPVALIIAPTRELANQVCDELRWLFAEIPRTRVDVVTGGTDIQGERRMLRKLPRVLVGTPGRLLDHLRNEAVDCRRVQHVVLDEADRMLEMGFRDELDAIIDALPKERRSHLVSATFGRAVTQVADRFQREVLHLEGTALGEANDDIEHIAQVVPPRQRYGALVNALMLAMGEQVLVFVDRRSDASDMAEALAGDGFAAMPFSGDLSQAQRTRTLHAFRSATISVLVCTDVAARGIDVPDISMVVHMSPPQNPDDYTHRSGRTGRAGRRGRSLLLVPPRGQHYVARLLRAAGIEASWQSAPSPKKVRRAVTKRTRRQLHERLDGPTSPSEKTMEYAKNLLQGRDAATIVATLLEMAEPRLPRDPADVETITPLSPDHLADRGHDRDRYHAGHKPRRKPKGGRGGSFRRGRRWNS